VHRVFSKNQTKEAKQCITTLNNAFSSFDKFCVQQVACCQIVNYM